MHELEPIAGTDAGTDADTNGSVELATGDAKARAEFICFVGIVGMAVSALAVRVSVGSGFRSALSSNKRAIASSSVPCRQRTYDTVSALALPWPNAVSFPGRTTMRSMSSLLSAERVTANAIAVCAFRAVIACG